MYTPTKTGREIQEKAKAVVVVNSRWEFSVALPWPPTLCHPNQAPRNLASMWGVKKRYRSRCEMLALARLAESGIGPPPVGHFQCTVEFRPPDLRHRDVLNLATAIKHAVDGVADALAVNDRLFRPWTLDFGPVAEGGEVVLRLQAGAGATIAPAVEW